MQKPVSHLNIWLCIVCLFWFIGFTAELHAQGLNQTNKIEINSRVIDEELNLNVRDIGHAEFEYRKKMEVLNEKDPSLFYFFETSDQFRKLSDITITVFDSSGTKEVKTYTIQDINEVMAHEGLVAEGKTLYFAIPHNQFPFVYEIRYTRKYNGLLNFPTYYFVNVNQYVEHSSYQITVPENLDIRYKAYSIDLPPTRSIDHGKITYRWELQHVQPIQHEQGTASYSRLLPRVEISPMKFKYGQYEGSMESWVSFGKWYDTLAKNEGALPEKYKAELKTLVAGAASDIEKAERIYDYLQHNFRYVLISLGIGGFKPASAASTYQNKYGDCKALSNFMQASLHEVGIQSYQCLINASYDQVPVDADFPRNSFNHVILCIPQKIDSVWLECTSKYNEFGVLGSFTENRSALLISEKGGTLVSTPKSHSASNQLNSHTTITLHKDGSGTASLNLQAKGDFQSMFLHALSESDEIEKKNFLVNQLKLKAADSYQIKCSNEDHNAMATIELAYDQVPEISTQHKIFLNKSLLGLCNENLPLTEHRTMDFYVEFPYQKTDTTTYILPVNYVPEHSTESKTISTEYFNYDETIFFQSQFSTLDVISKLELKKHIVRAEDYNNMLASYNEIMEYCNRKIIITK